MLLLPFLLASLLSPLRLQLLPFFTTRDKMVAPVMITYPQWLMFGDSITQQSFAPGGLGQAMADDYQRRLDMVNRGYGGYNSLWGLEVAPHVR